jgi:hypothetical protein
MKPIAKGFVESVKRTTFWCRMSTEAPWKDTNLECQIYKHKLSKRELPFLEDGAYIAILKGGTLRFSRIRGWTKKEIEQAKMRAAKRYKEMVTEFK